MIIILCHDYKEFRQYCIEHNFNHRVMMYVYDSKDLDKVYGLEIRSMITLDGFFKHTIADQQLMFRTVISRIRL